MANIGGNITATIQKRTDNGKNEIGEKVSEWINISSPIGWLGLQSGESNYSNFNAKIEESTHIFMCDYDSSIYSLSDSDTRIICKGNVYDVLLIDNPDEMNEQLEIYLKKVGAWNGE